MATVTEERQIPQQEQNLDAIIERAKKDLKRLFTRRVQVIRTLGSALEKVAADPSEVCRRIKAALKEEIGEKLVSVKDIERYCYERWKKKTKPKKNDKTSISEEKQESEWRCYIIEFKEMMNMTGRRNKTGITVWSLGSVQVFG